MKNTNDLHAFLRKHGAVNKFKRANALHGHRTYEAACDVAKFSPIIICCSFAWADTEEGLNYWDDLDAKFGEGFGS